MASPSSGSLFLLGASHRTAPLEMREKISLTPVALGELLRRWREIDGLSELAALNTCNRLELYAVAAHAGAVEKLRAFFCELQGLPAADFGRVSFLLENHEALRHLIEVSAGLDSQMLGEAEIFGQVKTAYAEAQAAGATGAVLNRVFQKSFQAAKWLRTTTTVGEGQVSVANVAVELAGKIFGDLEQCRLLVLGAGEIGEKTLKAFRSRGAARFTVCSRTLERAEALAAELGGEAAALDQLGAALSASDIAVCSTAAPQAVITCDLIAQALRRRGARPLFLIDLALPRDVEPAAAELENVFLYNLDDLAQIAEENRLQREAEVTKARLLAEEKAKALWTELGKRAGGSGDSAAVS